MVAHDPPPPKPTREKKVTSPAPTALAISTSSVASIVYAAKASTSWAAMPASSRAIAMARQASAFSDGSRCLANSVWPMPTMAARSFKGVGFMHLPI